MNNPASITSFLGIGAAGRASQRRQALVEGDKVHINIQISATHTGTYDVSRLGLPIPPIPATRKHRSWPKEELTFTVRDGKVSDLNVKSQPEGGVMGTLVWLGVTLPAPQP